MMYVVLLLVGLTQRATDVLTVLSRICRPVGGGTVHAAGQVVVTS
jgi:hypothetical protein